MKLVVQRVSKASVFVNNNKISEIDLGFLVYLGISINDKIDDIFKYVNKLISLRIFSDIDGKLNLNIKDVKGKILLVSQFTLMASTKKGNRPSFINALKGEDAILIYEKFTEILSKNVEVKTGIFGENMQIYSINDGPVTIILEDL